MTLTQAMTILETLLNQQMSDEAEDAIRTVLDGMKQNTEKDADMVLCCGETTFCKSARGIAEVVRCKDCMHHKGLRCLMWNDVDTIDGTYPNAYDEDYCSCGENTYTF